MERSRVVYKGVMSDIYYKNDGIRCSCIYYSGFPATLGPNDLINLLVNRGLMVIQPHYPGTYDSCGEFTPDMAIFATKIISEGLEYDEMLDVKRNGVVKIPKIKYVIADSFGSFVAIRSFKYLPFIEKVLLFSPAVTYGKSRYMCGFKEKGMSFLEYVKRSRPFTYRLGDISIWASFYAGEMNGNVSYLPNNNINDIVGVIGRDDRSFDINMFIRNFEKIICDDSNIDVKVKKYVIDKGKHSVKTLINDDVKKIINDY